MCIRDRPKAPPPVQQTLSLALPPLPVKPSISTPAYEDPSLLWYDNTPSFVDADDAGTSNSKEYIDHPTIMCLRRTSISRKNFASLLVRQIFTNEERSTSNVSGRNKTKLDPTRIAYVKQKTFEMWPLKQGEDMKRA